MLEDFRGNSSRAAGLLSGDGSDYAPFYAYRYGFTKERSDLEKALALDPEEWRYCKMLAYDLVAGGEASSAAKMLEKFYSCHSDNVHIGDALIDAYIASGQYAKAEKVVDKIVYLPFEGLKDSHAKYRCIKLHLAAEAVDKGRLSKAGALVEEALLWPERLGVGKPYDDEVDTSAEEWLKSEIAARRSSRGPFSPLVPQLEKYLK